MEVNSDRYPVGKYGHSDNGINNNKQSSGVKIIKSLESGHGCCINKEHQCRDECVNEILLQEHLTHLLQSPMQALPASSLVGLQLAVRVQFPGMAESAFLDAFCACVEDFSD